MPTWYLLNFFMLQNLSFLVFWDCLDLVVLSYHFSFCVYLSNLPFAGPTLYFSLNFILLGITARPMSTLVYSQRTTCILKDSR